MGPSPISRTELLIRITSNTLALDPHTPHILLPNHIVARLLDAPLHGVL